MIVYQIPGREDLVIENLVLDYNGTIAHEGKLIEGVEELINELSQDLDVYILTADTYGTVRKQCENIQAQVKTFPRENAGLSKKEIVQSLEGGSACLGNGFNDIPMFDVADLAIAILEGEGMSPGLLNKAHILSRSINEALGILLNKDMIRATLRN